MSADAKNPVAEAVNSAEVIRDVLEELIDQVRDDAGAVFTPHVLERLAELRMDDRARFENLRGRLKRAGCRVIALDEAINELIGGKNRKPTQADMLVELALTAEVFHASDDTCFADIEVDGHRETWPIRSKGFRRWLTRQFFAKTESAPNSEALQAALNVVEARSHFDGPLRAVFVRVGEFEGRLYLDLADQMWRAVEIDGNGWRIVERPPVRFRRPVGLKPLPVPQNGGSISELRAFLNVRSESEFVLVIAFALAALRSVGPYPVLVLSGEQGSAKSTFCGMLRAFLDPNLAPLRALPREDRDLFIAANNGHLLVFDNVSGLPSWTSDTLCRLATGGSFAVRQHYTDQDEVLFDASRPIVLNGIEDVVTRADLADRAIFLTLDPIPEASRQPEQKLWAVFEEALPRILGALLNAMVRGVGELPTTQLEKLPRMADFARWVVACEGALWERGTFLAAYHCNRDDAVDSVTDADPVASVLRNFMDERSEWAGTATDLLELLASVAGEAMRSARSWPNSARALAGRLRRSAASLRALGISIHFSKEGRSRTRIIHIVVEKGNG